MTTREGGRVIALHGRQNLYNEGVYRALESLGVEVVDGIFAGRWLLRNVRPGDVADIHWPSFFYQSRGSRLDLLIGFLRFTALLLLVRARGGRLAWTAHNLFPHDRAALPFLDVLGRHLVIALASRIMVHGPEARQLLAARFPAAGAKAVEIPHGHWIGTYANTMSRSEARQRLGLRPDTYTYLFLGLCKPYKNVDGLIRSFAAVPGQVALVIAGRFQDPAYEQLIRELAARDPRVQLHARYLPDDELQVFLNACDVVVAPYREILTSGSAILAASFGRPIVSLDKGFLRDVVTPATGLLFPPDEPGALERALLAVRDRRFDPATIVAHVANFRFSDAAGRYAAALELLRR